MNEAKGSLERIRELEIAVMELNPGIVLGEISDPYAELKKAQDDGNIIEMLHMGVWKPKLLPSLWNYTPENYRIKPELECPCCFCKHKREFPDE